MKKINIRLIILFVIILIGSSNTTSTAERSGKWGNLSWSFSDGVLTISGEGEMNNFAYNTYSSSSVHDSPDARGWFSVGYYNIKKVIIEYGVTSIGDYAFYPCGGLRNVTIASSVTKIGQSAFSSTGLQSITIPNSVTTISDGAFKDCRNLTSVTLSSNLTTLNYRVFCNCNMLTNITLPDSLTDIDIDVFEHCTSLSEITIPANVKSVGYRAFSGCSNLTNILVNDNNINFSSIDGVLYNKSITNLLCCPGGKESINIPNTVTSIERAAFHYCSKLNNVALPNSVIYIGQDVFRGCTGLTTVTIPSNVKQIDDFAFYECSQLKRIDFLEGIESIGEQAFYGCDRIMEVTIPSSVKNIGQNAFSGCSNLKGAFILAYTTSFGNLAFGKNQIIYCFEYSDADYWATDNGYQLVYLDNYNPEDDRSIILSKDEIRIELGETYKLEAEVFPMFDNPDIVWTSSDPSIVSVDNGELATFSIGNCTVTVTVGNNSKNTQIIVFGNANSFEFLESELWILAKTEAQLVIVNIEPAGADCELSWSCSDDSVVVVDENGGLSTKKTGDATITAITNNGVQREALIHVCYPVSDICFSESEVNIKQGGHYHLTANVTMRTQSCVNHLVTFTSSDESIATVDAHGIVTGVSNGTVTITATADSGISASCTVIINHTNTLTLPASTTTIKSKAFANLASVDIIVVPKGVTSIALDAFAGSDMTLSVVAGSYAESWAIENDVQYIIRQ